MCTEGAWGISAKDIRLAIGMDIVKRAVNCGFFFQFFRRAVPKPFYIQIWEPFLGIGEYTDGVVDCPDMFCASG